MHLKPAKVLRSFFSAAAWIIPHYCAVCGGRVEAADTAAVEAMEALKALKAGKRAKKGISSLSIPLCAGCGAKLTPISGRRCGICGRELYSEKDTCYGCRDVERSCSEIYPLFKYVGLPATLVREYKSSKRRSLAPFWACLLSEVIDTRWPGRTIVPVPPRPEKIRHREWDQVEAIVAVLEKGGYRVERILERHAGVQQKKLNKAMRKTNAEKAYSVISARISRMPADVILVDDVYTTGATIEACAKTLRDNGAVNVCALVIAAD
jgi:ComF family protein